MARNSWSSYRILIAGGSGTGKANALLYLLNNDPDNDKVYSYAKNRNEAKYKLLINERESTDLKNFNDSKAFIEYSLDMNIFIKILKNAIQIKSGKYWLYLMIWLLICLIIKNLIQ